jgi:hypothetical protein
MKPDRLTGIPPMLKSNTFSIYAGFDDDGIARLGTIGPCLNGAKDLSSCSLGFGVLEALVNPKGGSKRFGNPEDADNC